MRWWVRISYETIIVHRDSSRNAEKSKDELECKQSCTGPRLEIGTSWVQNSNANHRVAKFVVWKLYFDAIFTLKESQFYPFIQLDTPSPTFCGKDANQSLSFGCKNVNWNPTFPGTCSVQSTNTFYSAQNTTYKHLNDTTSILSKQNAEWISTVQKDINASGLTVLNEALDVMATHRQLPLKRVQNHQHS